MKRQHKEISKNFKYVLVCLALIIGEAGGIIVKSASVFSMVTLNLIVFVPIFVKRYKYDTDLGNMMVGGLIRGAIWFGLWVASIYISRGYPLLEKIVDWPLILA